MTEEVAPTPEPSPNDVLKDVAIEAHETVRKRILALRRVFRRPLPRLVLFGTLLALVFLSYVLTRLTIPLATGAHEVIVLIPEGASVSYMGELLRGQGIVSDAVWFELAVRLTRVGDAIKAGEYYFASPISPLTLAMRLGAGEYGIDQLLITVPEGATTYQMAEIFAERLPLVTVEEFTALTEGKEGYLFPDTYRFLPDTTTAEVVETLERTFSERLLEVEAEIAAFGVPVHEVITMASLLEREASDFDERRTIAGILWERIKDDMPLQVDAVFGYIERRETFNPSFSTLEIDSPYNTYKYAGLPPGPIGSPSIEAIRAAVTPIPTDARYYLHGQDGTLHIAVTFEEHKENRRRYLD